MDSNFLQAGMGMLASARRSGRLGFGRLAKSTARRDGVRRMVDGDGWCLSGEVHPQMFAAMGANGIQGQKGLLVTLPNGHGLYVLTLQSGVWQHRIVMALEGSVVRNCLLDCHSQSLQLALNAGRESEPLWTPCTVELPGVDGLPEDGADTSDFLYEQAALAIQMLFVHTVQIDGMPALEDVCVSVVQTSGNHSALKTDLKRHGLLGALNA